MPSKQISATTFALAMLANISLSAGELFAGEINTGPGEVAIKGYDAVAYFTMGEAVKGSDEIAQSWLGATWHFANEEHREAFAKNPIKFAPQYGGYCAIGVSLGRRVIDIDPEAWRIVEGKLYLNYGHDDPGDPHELDRALRLHGRGRCDDQLHRSRRRSDLS